MESELKKEILDILDNVYYWETCPQEYNDRIDKIKKELECQKDRFMVFIFPDYYPEGGMNDFRISFGSKEEAIDYGKNIREESEGFYNYQIYDSLLKNVLELNCN